MVAMSLQSRSGWLLDTVGPDGLFDWKGEAATALKARLDDAEVQATRVEVFRHLFTEQLAGRFPAGVDAVITILADRQQFQATIQVYRNHVGFLIHPVGTGSEVGFASEVFSDMGLTPYGYNAMLDAELSGATAEEHQARAAAWGSAFDDPSPLTFSVTAAPSFAHDTGELPVAGPLAYGLSAMLPEGLPSRAVRSILRRAVAEAAPLFEGRMDLLVDPIDDALRAQLKGILRDAGRI